MKNMSDEYVGDSWTCVSVAEGRALAAQADTVVSADKCVGSHRATHDSRRTRSTMEEDATEHVQFLVDEITSVLTVVGPMYRDALAETIHADASDAHDAIQEARCQNEIVLLEDGRVTLTAEI